MSDLFNEDKIVRYMRTPVMVLDRKYKTKVHCVIGLSTCCGLDIQYYDCKITELENLKGNKDVCLACLRVIEAYDRDET